MVVYRILLLIVSLGLLGCGDHSSNGQSVDERKISSSILGAWEIESIALDGKSARTERPDPGNPYQKRESSDWIQLYFTTDQVQWIHTDFVFVRQMTSPYRVEGRKIVTIDPPDSSLVDLIVYAVSDNTLTIGFDSSEGDAPRMRWTFHRISNDSLASKTAKEITYESQFHSRIERQGQPDLSIARSEVGRIDYSRDGVYDSVLCFLDRGENLQFHFSVIEVNGDSIRSASETDSLHLNFQGLKLDLSGPGHELTVAVPVHLSAHSSRNWVFDEFPRCQTKVLRQGAEVAINVTCADPAGKTKASFAGSCLLRQGFY